MDSSGSDRDGLEDVLPILSRYDTGSSWYWCYAHARTLGLPNDSLEEIGISCNL
jgi:hypothetical protein